MPECKGECKRQAFQTRNFRIESVKAETDNPAGCASEEIVKGSTEAVVAFWKAKRELEQNKWLLKCEDHAGYSCRCAFFEGDPPWTEWSPVVLKIPITVDGCKYSVTCEGSIRSRVRTGLCVPFIVKTAAMGFIPEHEITITTGSTAHMKPDDLKKIGKILT
jgi:hypothetical protein